MPAEPCGFDQSKPFFHTKNPACQFLEIDESTALQLLVRGGFPSFPAANQQL
jgi:hypothetical protein